MDIRLLRNRTLLVLVIAALILQVGSLPTALYASPEASPEASPHIDPLDRPVGRVAAEVEDVQVTPRLNELVAFDAELRDEQGNLVRMGDFFQDGRPVILNLGYYSCPSLCSRVLNALLESLQGLSMTPGQEFTIVTLSIDHLETPALAAAKKEAYIAELGNPEAAAGWHFLTGSERNVRLVADSVGFNFRWDPNKRMYAHPAALIIATPDGRVSRYLFGITYPSRELRRSLVEASEGRIGTLMDQIFLACFSFDAHAGVYSLRAMALMQAAAILMVLTVILYVGRSLLRERASRRLATAGATSPGNTTA